MITFFGDGDYGLGIEVPGSRTTFPLSREVLLRMSPDDNGGYAYGNASNELKEARKTEGQIDIRRTVRQRA